MKKLALTAAVLLAVACAPAPDTAEPDNNAGDAPGNGARQAIDAAMANPDRPEKDRADDENRKPGEVIAFFGIEPGMTVLDLFAGSGYYTEILSHVVGPEGKVIFHDNQAYLGSLTDAIEQRFANGRLPNVERLVAEASELDLQPGSLDAVLWILGYHDIWYQSQDGSWPQIDQEALLGKLYQGLKPGGVLGIVDHSALTGSDPADVGNRLHRIDEQTVRDQVEAAGFGLEESSDVLRHPEDDRTVLVFDPSIRRKTDRFVLRFRKPVEG